MYRQVLHNAWYSLCKFSNKKHDNIYVHVNVRNKFGSFIIHNFISHIRNKQLKILSSEKDLGLLINRINIYFLIGYVVKWN
jgi:hypothetical protein